MPEPRGLKTPSSWMAVTLIVLAATASASWVAFKWWAAETPRLQVLYVVDAVRLQTGLDLPTLNYFNKTPKRPAHTYTLVLKNGRMALLEDDPPFEVRKEEITKLDKLGAFVRSEVYQGHSIWWEIKYPLALTGLAFFLSVKMAGMLTKEKEEGRYLRGPRIVSHQQWNRRVLGWFGRKQGFYIETQ